MIFLDIETQNDWSGEDIFRIEEMRVSYVGVIDDEGREYDFWEDDMDNLMKLMSLSDMIVHYNGFTFDMPVLANYLGDTVLKLPQLDLMVAVAKKIGFRPKLDDLTKATLGHGKIGKGYDAVKYWASGDLENLKKYCLEDVRLTRQTYEYGIQNGSIKYFDKNGFLTETDIDWSLGERVASKSEDEDVISMF